jgi:outer membrane protein assembly factor BamB
VSNHVEGRKIPGMQTFWRVASLATTFCLLLPGADWPTQSGGPQRDAWARGERTITKENAGSLELLYKYKTDNQAKGLYALSAPIVSGMLITYRGFKEMLVFGGSSDNVYSIDADLNRLLWKRHFDFQGGSAHAESNAGCPGGLTASMAMEGSSSASVRAPVARPAPPKQGAKPAPARPREEGRVIESAKAKLATGFGRLGGMFIVSSDGYLHTLNSSTGEDLLPPVKFVPPHSNVSSLNVLNNIVYAATTNECGGKPNALYAVDLTSETTEVWTFEIKGSEFAGIAATAIGRDGTIYLQAVGAKNSKFADYTVIALTPELQMKDYFTPPDAGPSQPGEAGITPTVFAWRDKELVVAGGKDGRLYVLDAASLGGTDHKKALIATEPMVEAAKNAESTGLRGAFSTWNDTESETRWVYAPFAGSLAGSAATEFPVRNGDVAKGGIAAFRVLDDKGQPQLKPVWTSGDLPAPAPPVTANGMVFALSTGEALRERNDKGKALSTSGREKIAGPAVLYALDGATGKQLYSSGSMAGTFAHPGTVAVANGRVYFTTHDNVIYCIGFSKLNPQLTDQ